MTTPEEVRRRSAVVESTANALREMEEAHVVAAIAGAAAALAEGGSALGREARSRLAESTGLSPEMVDWGLTTSCGGVTPGALRRLIGKANGPPGTVATRARLAAVILSGNVFSASLRAVVLPLLARVPVVAKASSRDDAFPRLFRRAIEESSPELAASLDVLTFRGGETALEDALFAQADVVAAYGSDATLADVRGRLPATTAFVPHGHGLGVIWVPGEQLERPGDLEARIALDVAAYDQRGCLSPHAIWTSASPDDARRFAERLARELDEVGRRLPRGSLPLEHGAQQLQWRGVAAARGDLFEGDGFAVSFEGEGPLRLSPGYRNVSVLLCADEEELGRRLLPLGMHLKALGVCGEDDARRGLAARLPAPLAPRVSEIGTMQTPPLDGLADGASPLAGLLRWIQVD